MEIAQMRNRPPERGQDESCGNNQYFHQRFYSAACIFLHPCTILIVFMVYQRIALRNAAINKLARITPGFNNIYRNDTYSAGGDLFDNL
jgi:hypothetical protein